LAAERYRLGETASVAGCLDLKHVSLEKVPPKQVSLKQVSPKQVPLGAVTGNEMILPGAAGAGVVEGLARASES